MRFHGRKRQIAPFEDTVYAETLEDRVETSAIADLVHETLPNDILRDRIVMREREGIRPHGGYVGARKTSKETKDRKGKRMWHAEHKLSVAWTELDQQAGLGRTLENCPSTEYPSRSI